MDNRSIIAYGVIAYFNFPIMPLYELNVPMHTNVEDIQL